jgi:hypothetical protein
VYSTGRTVFFFHFSYFDLDCRSYELTVAGLARIYCTSIPLPILIPATVPLSLITLTLTLCRERHTTEDGILHSYSRENLKSYMSAFVRKLRGIQEININILKSISYLTGYTLRLHQKQITSGICNNSVPGATRFSEK